jgi:hypothetical protein
VFKALISTRTFVLEGFQLVPWFGSWPGPLTRCELGLASSPPKCAARTKSRTLALIFLTLGKALRRALSSSRILRHCCRFFVRAHSAPPPMFRVRVLPTGFELLPFLSPTSVPSENRSRLESSCRRFLRLVFLFAARLRSRALGAAPRHGSRCVL